METWSSNSVAIVAIECIPETIAPRASCSTYLLKNGFLGHTNFLCCFINPQNSDFQNWNKKNKLSSSKFKTKSKLILSFFNSHAYKKF